MIVEEKLGGLLFFKGKLKDKKCSTCRGGNRKSKRSYMCYTYEKSF